MIEDISNIITAIIGTYALITIGIIILNIAIIITFFRMFYTLKAIEKHNEAIIDELYQIQGEIMKQNTGNNNSTYKVPVNRI